MARIQEAALALAFAVLALQLQIATACSVELLITDRVVMSNDVTLECQNCNNLRPLMNAEFWVNCTSLQLTRLLPASEYAYTDGGSAFRFTVNPDIEGFYHCGDIDQGILTTDGLELIAYPSSSDDHQEYAVEAGQPVRMECGIPPGKLRSRYCLRWRRNGILINTECGGSSSQYQVNVEDFSLRIDSTDLSDSGGYQCEVDVTNPNGHNGFATGRFNTLLVFDPPQIRFVPENITIREQQEHTVTFTCMAYGVPELTMKWMHDGRDVTEREDSARFAVNTVSSDFNTYRSTLTISQIQVQDTGIYQCLAQNEVDGANGEQTFSASQNAVLTILTTNFFASFGITAEGDLLLRIRLPGIVIHEPLALILNFINPVTSEPYGQSISFQNPLFIQDDSFIGKEVILHQVENTKLPAAEFKVTVALLVSGVRGESVEGSQILNATQPLPLPPCENMTIQNCPPMDCGLPDADVIAITIATLLGAIIIIIFVIGTLIVVNKHFARRKSSRLQVRILDKVETLMKEGKEDKEFKREVLQTFREMFREVHTDEAEEGGDDDDDTQSRDSEPGEEGIATKSRKKETAV